MSFHNLWEDLWFKISLIEIMKHNVPASINATSFQGNSITWLTIGFKTIQAVNNKEAFIFHSSTNVSAT